MSKQVPVPLGAGRRDRPEVIVLDAPRSSPDTANPLLRLALGLTPDVLRLIERSANRRSPVVTRQPELLLRPERRRFISRVQHSEVEVDTWVPFVRKVTVRRSSAWASDLPVMEPAVAPEPRRRRVRAVGLMGVGGAIALATVGLLARGGGSVTGSIPRRG